MEIMCKSCRHSETTNTDFWVKVIGAAAPVGGFWAWVTFFFAGTGLALPICIAMVFGGVGMLAYKDEIVKWVTEEGYNCPKCGAKSWELVKNK
jgi:hypothetical protein